MISSYSARTSLIAHIVEFILENSHLLNVMTDGTMIGITDKPYDKSGETVKLKIQPDGSTKNVTHDYNFIVVIRAEIDLITLNRMMNFDTNKLGLKYYRYEYPTMVDDLKADIIEMLNDYEEGLTMGHKNVKSHP